MSDTAIDLDAVNRDLGRDPGGLLQWAVGLDRRAAVSSSFGPYSAVTLHLAVQAEPDIPVIWVDAGYGTAAMYRYVDEIEKRLGLNLYIVRPRRSRAHREAADGPMPGLGDPGHAAFTHEVKIEPFDRAMQELGATTWITGIRAEETAARARMQPVSMTDDGILKVAPVFHWSARDLHAYVKRHDLPNNFDYFDPTKVEDKRECGLHTA